MRGDCHLSAKVTCISFKLTKVSIIFKSVTSLFYLLISSIVGGIGWWLGEYFGLAAAFIGSTVGSILGLWWAYRFQQSLAD